MSMRSAPAREFPYLVPPSTSETPARLPPGPPIASRDWHDEERTLRIEIDRLKALLDKERESSAVNTALIESLREEEEKARCLLEERSRDADASFALAEEQSREVDRLKASFDARLRETAALNQAKQVDYDALAIRAHEAARQTSAEWTPHITLADAFLTIS
ncbi:MAG: hypothetical protein IPP28_00380 [Xanthomonadales bacterium]|nr:hypothetical protein [Xanthomonadales bacterium]